MEKSKTFKDSRFCMNNRNNLSLSGVEKVFGANENRVFLKAAGNNLIILGTSLSIEKLDIENGLLELVGTVDEIKYNKSRKSGSFLKRIFK